MDGVFKESYTFFAFLQLDMIEPVWQHQVRDLPELWYQLNDAIDRDRFFKCFSMKCQQRHLPVEEYDLDSAFHKAQNDWAQELMVATADYILKWYEDCTFSTPVASWRDGHICVDQSVCAKYREWFFVDYVSDYMSDLNWMPLTFLHHM